MKNRVRARKAFDTIKAYSKARKIRKRQAKKKAFATLRARYTAHWNKWEPQIKARIRKEGIKSIALARVFINKLKRNVMLQKLRRKR